MPTSLGPAEILVVMIVALIVLGPAKLPEAGRQVGKTIAEIRKWSQGFQDEIRSVIDPDLAAPSYPAQPTPPPTPVPTLPAETGVAADAPDPAANGTVIGSNGYLSGPAPPDTRPPDTRPPDTRPPDTRPPDTRPADVRPPDPAEPAAGDPPAS